MHVWEISSDEGPAVADRAAGRADFFGGGSVDLMGDRESKCRNCCQTMLIRSAFSDKLRDSQ